MPRVSYATRLDIRAAYPEASDAQRRQLAEQKAAHIAAAVGAVAAWVVPPPGPGGVCGWSVTLVAIDPERTRSATVDTHATVTLYDGPPIPGAVSSHVGGTAEAIRWLAVERGWPRRLWRWLLRRCE